MRYVNFDCSTFAAVLTTTYIELRNFHEYSLSGFNLPRTTSIGWTNIAERNRSIVVHTGVYHGDCKNHKTNHYKIF
jgi:hypothetical protein